MAETVLIAHRGLEDTHPENTLPAFQAALDLGMAVEFDIATSADGHIVVIHDDTVDRTTNGSGRVAQMTLEQLRELDAGSWKGEQFSGAVIPTLDEALELIAGYDAPTPAIALHINLLPPGIIGNVCAALDRHGLMDRTVGIGVIGQSVDVRRRFYEGSATFQCSTIAQTPESLDMAVRDPYSNWVYARFVPSKDDVAVVHDANKKFLVSGDSVSNDIDEAQRAVEAGPDAVLTWHPTELHHRVNG